MEVGEGLFIFLASSGLVHLGGQHLDLLIWYGQADVRVFSGQGQSRMEATIFGQQLYSATPGFSPLGA